MLSQNIITSDTLQQLIEIFHGISGRKESKIIKSLLFNFCSKSGINNQEFVFFGSRCKILLLSIVSLKKNVSSLGKNLLSVALSYILSKLLSFFLEVVSFLLGVFEHS